MKRTTQPSQEDKDKVVQGNADRGDARANGPRGSTRATPETRRAAEEGIEHDRTASRESTRGERPGTRDGDPGGSKIRKGG